MTIYVVYDFGKDVLVTTEYKSQSNNLVCLLTLANAKTKRQYKITDIKNCVVAVIVKTWK
jgi:hypothetical protein